MKKLFRNNRGDTLIEVLLAITVISFILAVSYNLANRSSQAVRQAQERSEALALAEAQVENLISYLNSSQPLPPGSGPFCMQSSSSIVDTGFGTIPADAQDDPLGGNYPPSCKFGTDNRYHSVVTRPSSDLYIATIRWQRISGSGNDELTIRHRVFRAPTSPAFSYEPEETGVGLPYQGAVKAIVKKIPPNSDNTTPTCGQAATQNRTGVGVRLLGGWNSGQEGSTTIVGGDSAVLFENLKFFDSYWAEITAVPERFEACPQGQGQSGKVKLSASNTAGNPAIINMKIRPICYQEQRTGPPYHHYGPPYHHYGPPYHHWHYHEREYWDMHYHDTARNAQPPNHWEGEYLHEFAPPPRLNNTRYWFNIYRYWWHYHGYYSDYLGYYGDYQGYYGDPYVANVCPS